MGVRNCLVSKQIVGVLHALLSTATTIDDRTALKLQKVLLYNAQ
jgi:hypothetical protein